ncbi:MAG: hypothetical protein H7173_10390 [Rhodoferax sp.]|nr:hypothetical protein [Pseudorhodobacter sp.]
MINIAVLWPGQADRATVIAIAPVLAQQGSHPSATSQHSALIIASREFVFYLAGLCMMPQGKSEGRKVKGQNNIEIRVVDQDLPF